MTDISLLAGTRQQSAERVGAAVQRGIENAGAALLVVLILILGASVTARYALGAPLIWSDEALSVVSGWFIMFAATGAFVGERHLKLTGLFGKQRSAGQRRLAMLAEGATVILVGSLILPSIQTAIDQWDTRTAILSIPLSVRSTSLVAGFIAMFLIGVTRFAMRYQWRSTLVLVAVFALAVVAGGYSASQFEQLGNLNLLLFFGVLLAIFILGGVPIAFAFGLATVAYLWFTTDIPLAIVVDRVDAGMASPLLLAIPLFVVLGLLLELTGMARVMVEFLAALIGNRRGGLSYVLLAAMYLVSGISGAKAADMAAVAPVLFPEMRRRGSDPRELVALLNASAVMSETIPPSLVLIVIGTVSSVSIAALFTGGLLPAAVAALALSGLVYVRSRRTPAIVVDRTTARSKLTSFAVALPALVLPIIIRTAVVEGVATATEVSVIGIAYTLACGVFLYGGLQFRKLLPALRQTATLSGVIILVIGMANGVSWSLSQAGIARYLAASLAGLPGGSTTFMGASILVFLVAGSILEGIPALVLFGPILFPVARLLGIQEVHYAMVAIIAMGIGLYAPPFGVGYYSACVIGEVDPGEAIGKVWPYLGVLLAVLILVALVPWLSTGLL